MRWQRYLHQSWQIAEPFLPGSLASLAIVSLLKFGAWQPLEHFVYTALFQLRGAASWDPRVVVVAIDEPSLKALGRFPWSRHRYTQLLNILTQAEASTVVLDILFPESSPDDPALAKGMAQQGRVVLSQAWDTMGTPLLPNSVLRESAATYGHIYQRQDGDGLTRYVAPQMQGIPALGLAATQVYSLVREPVPSPDLSQPLWINWRGPVSESPTYSYIDILQQRVPAKQLQDKIVLVGITATGFDPLRTPFNQNPPTTNVYLHATIVNNLLQQNFLKVLPDAWIFMGLLLAGPSLSAVFSRWSHGQQLAGLMALCLGWSVLSLLLFRGGYWMPVAAPIALGVVTTAAVMFSQQLKANLLLHREVDRLWQTYHRDLVVQTAATSAEVWQFSQPTLLLPQLLPQLAKLAAMAEQFGRSQAAQSAVARSVSIGLVAADLEGIIWFCNPIATNYLQVQVGDRLMQLIPQWMSQTQWQLNWEALGQGRLGPSGSPVNSWEMQQGDSWFELKLEPMYRPHLADFVPVCQINLNSQNRAAGTGELNGLLLVIEDITNRKQVEKNLQQQMQELQQLGQLKDDFLSTVSHELRTPMTNMKMAIRMLQLATTEERRTRYLQILEDECTREISLINDLLDLQRLEAGAKTIQPAEICLQDWLPQLIHPFYERAATRQQTLYLQIAPHLPSLYSDSSSLGRVVTELVNNACKYTPPAGKIEVAVSVTSQRSDSRMILQISNSGSEIPAVELSKIFDKFYRVTSGDRWEQGGTGLGLALVKKLVEYLGGTIQVTSQLGQTTFTVELPL
ncbi:MAG TPA: CHASE2 domain-containing protein [Coleofasciculaceae cyanobacterium]